MTDTKQRNWLGIGLWVAQVLLAIMFGMAGFMKIGTPVDQLLANGMAWVGSSPEWLVRFIGIAEVAGAIGIIAPAATKILPFLTPLAALGFAIIQVLAIGVHVSMGDFGQTWPINLVLLALSVFVVWGRWKARPIASR